MMSDNQNIFNRKRDDYINGILSHDEFHLWLAEFLDIPGWVIPFTREQLINSNDRYFNDLPIETWEKRHIIVSNLAYKKLEFWSMAETVVVLKIMARHLIQRK